MTGSRTRGASDGRNLFTFVSVSLHSGAFWGCQRDVMWGVRKGEMEREVNKVGRKK